MKINLPTIPSYSYLGIVLALTIVLAPSGVALANPPTAVCQDITVQLDPAGTVSITPQQVDGGSFDNNSIDSLAVDPASFACADSGANTVVLTVWDNAGQTATCTASVTVEDSSPPVIVCPLDLTLEWPAGFNLSPVAPDVYQDPSLDSLITGAPVSDDNCAVTARNFQDILIGPSPANCPHLWIVERTWIVTDASGLTASCVQTFSFTDTTPPVVTPPAPITLECNTAGGVPSNDAAVINWLGTATATDNCGIPTLINDSPQPLIPVGTTTVIWTATDLCGQTATASSAITVEDTTPPTITCPGLIIAECSAPDGVPVGDPQLVLFFAGASASDICSTPVITHNAPGLLPVGVNPVTFTATDSVGLTATCMAFLVVQDTQPPVITCPASITVECSAPGGTPAADAQFAAFVAAASDTCDPSVDITSDAPTLYPPGATTVTFTATDDAGLTATCAASVTVVDTTPPTITCPPDIPVNNDPGACVATVTVGTATASDICSIPTVAGVRDDGFALNQPYPEGITTVTWTATDSAGLTATCDQTVTVTLTQTLVELLGSNIFGCAGDTSLVPVTVTNTSAQVESLTVICTDNLNPGSPDTTIFAGVLPGQSKVAQVPVVCIGAETHILSCTVTATMVVGGVPCQVTASGNASVICLEPKVSITALNTTGVVGDTVQIPVTVTNTGASLSNLTVICTIDGVPQDTASFPSVPGGGVRNENLTVICTSEFSFPVMCTAVAELTQIPGCTATDSSEATVVCSQPCFNFVTVVNQAGSVSDQAMTGPDVESCIGDTAKVPLVIENCSLGDQTYQVICDGAGVVDTMMIVGVPRGEIVTPEFPIFCTTAGTHNVTCEVTAWLTSRPGVTTTQTRHFVLECYDVCATSDVAPAITCLGNMVDIPTTVTNCSSIPADLVSTCVVDGDTLDTRVFNNVAPGSNRQFTIWTMCDSVGDHQVEAHVTASPTAFPGCSFAVSDTATLTCREICAELVVGDVSTCPQETVWVPVTVTNCGSEPTDMTLTCTLDPAGPNPPPTTLLGVPAGTSQVVMVPMVCNGFPGEFNFDCNLWAELPTFDVCTVDTTAQRTLRCFNPALALAGPSAREACVGDVIEVPYTVTNTGAGSQAFFIEVLTDCPVDSIIDTAPGINPAAVMPGTPPTLGAVAGGGDGRFSVQNDRLDRRRGFSPLVVPTATDTLAAGDSLTATIVIPCNDAGVCSVQVAVLAVPLGSSLGDPDMDCIATDTLTVAVTCREARISLTAQSIDACVGDTALVPVTVYNEAIESAYVEARCTVGGIPAGPVITSPSVAAGDSISILVPVLCDVAGIIAVECEAISFLDSNPACTDTVGPGEAPTALVTCRETTFTLSLTASDTLVCVGDTVLVSGVVINTSPTTIDGVTTCTLNGAVVGVEPATLDPGQPAVVNFPVRCDSAGVLNFECIVVAALQGFGCPTADTASVTVTCIQPAVEIGISDATVCNEPFAGIFQTKIPITVTNTSALSESVFVTCTATPPSGPVVTVLGPLVLAPAEVFLDSLEVICDPAINGLTAIPVICDVVAKAVIKPTCQATASDTATVSCLFPNIDKQFAPTPQGDFCVGDSAVWSCTALTNINNAPTDYKLTLLIDGVPTDSMMVAALAPGANTSFILGTYVCTTPGPHSWEVKFSNNLTGFPDCVLEVSSLGSFNCVGPCLTAAALPAAGCVGDSVCANVTVENCGTEPVNLSVVCEEGGVPVPGSQLSFPATVAPGATDSLMLCILCDTVGVRTFDCIVTATDAATNCVLIDTVQVTVQCFDACVEITAADVTVCAGDSARVTASVKNCSTGDASGVFFFQRGADTPIAVPIAIGAGDSMQVETAFFCPDPDTFTVVLNAQTVTNLGNCTAVDVDSITVRCVDGGLSVNRTVTSVGPGLAIVTTTVKNTGGLTLNPISVQHNLPAGASILSPPTAGSCLEVASGTQAIIFTPLSLAPGDSCQVFYLINCANGADTLTATAVCEPNPAAAPIVATEIGNVICTIVASFCCIDLNSPSVEVCEGDTVTVPLTISNCGTAMARLDLSYSLDGVPQTPVSYDDVPGGEDRILNIPVPGNQIGIVAIECTGTATLVEFPILNETVNDTTNVDVTPCGVVAAGDLAVTELLLRAYPNPVRSHRATILYEIPEHLADRPAELQVFDVSGRLVRKLVTEPQTVGRHSITWDLNSDLGVPVRAGVYFTRLKAGGESRNMRLLILKR